MIKEAIEKILQISKPEPFEHAGRKWLISPVGNQEILPACTRLESCSLDGLIMYARRFFPQSANSTSAFIHVESPTVIKLYGEMLQNGAHPLAYVATAKVNHFPFGNKLSQEEMIIKLRCCFAENEDITRLIAGISALTSGPVTTSNDDGISQTITVKSGVSLKAEAPVNPIRKLSAYRSFSGIASQDALFLFRIHQDKEKGSVLFSLHDMEGDLWITQTVAGLVEYILTATDSKINVY
jgi:hypothetical protein